MVIDAIQLCVFVCSLKVSTLCASCMHCLFIHLVMYVCDHMLSDESDNTSNLFWIRQVLENTSKRWRSDKTIDPDLFTALNVSLTCDPPCPPEHMWPRDCQHDPTNKIVQFDISAVRPAPNITVFQALPFDLYKHNSGGYCRHEYQGPPLASFNNRTKRTCLIKEQQLTSAFIDCLTTDPTKLYTQK